jgi:lantibiotic modifying enzyme
MTFQKDTYDSLLVQIAGSVADTTLQDASLLSGRAGHALFLAYLSQHTADPALLDVAIDRLNECAEHFSQEELTPGSFTFGGGAVGLAWVVKHLINKDILPAEALALIQGVDEVTENFLAVDFKNNYYDPLYGYIGTGMYLLASLPSPAAVAQLKAIVDVLLAEAVRKDDFYMWEDKKRQSIYFDVANTTLTCDGGLAHGVAGILSFLCKLYTHPHFAAETHYLAVVASLIEGTTQWLLSFDKLTADPHYTLPDFVTYAAGATHTELAKRLAWCYGDLTMGYALLKAAQIFERPDWVASLRRIVERSATTPLARSGVVKGDDYIDPTLCHGTCGIALLFARLAAGLNSPLVAAAAEHWRDLTVTEVSRMIREGSLQCEHPDDPRGSGLLYGYSGIGLALLSLRNAELSTWEEGVLL